MSAPLKVETQIQYLETLFTPWRTLIGNDYPGYRNHVYRMVQFCWALKQAQGKTLSKEDKQKIMIAAAFHDIGIWIENTVDYIEPSIPPAMAYLESQNLSDWKDEVKLMISEHHKLREYTGEYQEIVELFRKADLVDFSLGLVKFNLPKSYIQAIKAALPNAGFHIGLVKKASKWFIRHPLNPAPMMKW